MRIRNMIKHKNRLFYKVDTILKTIFLSKRFTYNGHKVTYYFKHTKSDVLIVIFSAFQSAKHPHYNYIQTLRNVNANQLFILDNFSKSGLGSYYLGTNSNYFIPNLVEKLVLKITKKYSISKISLCGSSKGGTSAIIHAFSYKDVRVDSVIVGCPQYKLGTYLYDHGGRDKMLEIAGANDLNSKYELDNYMKKVLLESIFKPTVYLMDSSFEDEFHKYDCNELTKDLNEFGIKFQEFDAKYIGHKNLAEPWKKYWLDVLNKLYGIKRQ